MSADFSPRSKFCIFCLNLDLHFLQFLFETVQLMQTFKGRLGDYFIEGLRILFFRIEPYLH